MTTDTLTKTDLETTPTRLGHALVRRLPTVARVLLGLNFFVFGLNGFLNFIPPPSGPLPEGAVKLATAFVESGYLFSLIKGTEVVAGLALLGGRFVPLALVVLAPVVVNIVAFHAFLLPSGTGFALALAGLTLYVAWAYRQADAPLLTARAHAAR